MILREIKENERKVYDKVVEHIMQSWAWGEFREKTGVEVLRLGEFEGKTLKRAYQLTLHPIPYLKQKIGYLPKGPMPTKAMVDGLTRIGKEKKVAFIKLEPNVEAGKGLESRVESLGVVKAKKSLFTKYNFVLDLTKSEEEILAGMHPKTRYNIKVAQKKGVEVYESTDDHDFEIYLKLYFETTHRQKYFGHTPAYHRLAWETLRAAGLARVVIARYTEPCDPKGSNQRPGTREKVPLVAWMLFSFGDTLYYPYGGSSDLHRDVMASNLVAWEAIKIGRRLKLKSFDMWGALGPNADPKDPWQGFHRFKSGYGPRHVEYIGSFDLVLNRTIYRGVSLADQARWIYLRLKR